MEDKFPKRLKDMRIRAGFTQASLGAALVPPLKKTTVASYEQGLSRPRPAALSQISRLLSCSSDYLLGFTDQINRPAPSVEDISRHECFPAVSDLFRALGLKVVRSANFPWEDDPTADGFDDDTPVARDLIVLRESDGKLFRVPNARWVAALDSVRRFARFEASDLLDSCEPVEDEA